MNRFGFPKKSDRSIRPQLGVCINTLSGGPARQSDSGCNSIWSHLSTMSKDFNIFVQWTPSYIGLPRNTLADSEAKRGSTLPQSSIPIDLASAKAQIRRTGQQEFHTRYLADPHSATHRTLTGEVSPQFHWRLGWSRSDCITVAQLRTGHSPLLASYLHRIGRQQSSLCPHCGGDDETAQHLLQCCPAHTQARTSTSTSHMDSTDPRRIMNFLETIGAVTRPLTGNERERESLHAIFDWLYCRCHSSRHKGRKMSVKTSICTPLPHFSSLNSCRPAELNRFESIFWFFVESNRIEIIFGELECTRWRMAVWMGDYDICVCSQR